MPPAHLSLKLLEDELFGLKLYQDLQKFASPQTKELLNELIDIENEHVKFWARLASLEKTHKLSFGKNILLFSYLSFARIFRDPAIHLILQSLEVSGIRNYITLYEIHKLTPLGEEIEKVLRDELEHEASILTSQQSLQLKPENIRNIFLGFNDGLVELLGAVSGFYAAFSNTGTILVASLTVGVAGAISMAAGVFAASSSENEVELLNYRKNHFLNPSIRDTLPKTNTGAKAGLIVGVSYFIGAIIPILPTLLGFRIHWLSILLGLIAAVIVSIAISLLSGMRIRKRIGINLAMITIAVSISYCFGLITKNIIGTEI